MTYFIFSLSIVLSFIALLLARTAGLDWDYHVDSVTYITQSAFVISGIDSFWGLFNQGYYLLVYSLGTSVGACIAMNMFLYSLTNVVIFNFLFGHRVTKKVLFSSEGLFFLLIAIFPYRLYLSTALLKDTSVILFSLSSWLLFLPPLNIRGVLSGSLFLLLQVIFRLQSIAYLMLQFRLGKFRSIIVFFLTLLIMVLALEIYTGSLEQTLLIFSETDMSVRDFDKVPNFSKFGLIGSFFRAFSWPIIASTGIFMILSPSLQFVFAGIGCVSLFIFFLFRYRFFYLTFPSYTVMFLIALAASSFTSYIRYCLPIIIISSLSSINSANATSTLKKKFP